MLTMAEIEEKLGKIVSPERVVMEALEVHGGNNEFHMHGETSERARAYPPEVRHQEVSKFLARRLLDEAALPRVDVRDLHQYGMSEASIVVFSQDEFIAYKRHVKEEIIKSLKREGYLK